LDARGEVRENPDAPGWVRGSMIDGRFGDVAGAVALAASVLLRESRSS
jgi:hypothetical protein